MLEVEGKTFHKFVEIKNYRTSTYLNYCDMNQKDRNILGLYVETKNKDKFFSDAQFYTEDDFVNIEQKLERNPNFASQLFK